MWSNNFSQQDQDNFYICTSPWIRIQVSKETRAHGPQDTPPVWGGAKGTEDETWNIKTLNFGGWESLIQHGVHHQLTNGPQHENTKRERLWCSESHVWPTLPRWAGTSDISLCNTSEHLGTKSSSCQQSNMNHFFHHYLVVQTCVGIHLAFISTNQTEDLQAADWLQVLPEFTITMSCCGWWGLTKGGGTSIFCQSKPAKCVAK